MIKEENSRRSFFKRAAAAMGVVAAAAGTKHLISASSASADGASAKYAADVAMQEKAVKANQLVVMTDDEKIQRLDELLNCHYQEIA
jgi:anaerobic selenocysteine-containing dehydrogenase